MAERRTIKLPPYEAQMTSMNYDVALLKHILEDETPSVPSLTYENAEEEPSLNDVYIELTIKQCLTSSTRRPSSDYTVQTMRATVDERLLDEWDNDDIEEIALYYNGDLTDFEVVDSSIYGEEYAGLYSIGNIGNIEICIMARKTDGTILTDYNWGRPSAAYKTNFSTYTKEDGTPVWGYVYQLDDSGFVWGNAFWSVGKMNCHVADPYLPSKQVSSFKCSHKLFKSFAGAYNYLRTGSTEEEIGGGGDAEPAEDRLKTLYYNSTVYSRLYNDSVVNRVGPSSINIQIQYKSNAGEELVNPNRAICGYVNTDNEPNNTTYFGNIHWLVKQGVKIIETNTNRISGASSTYTGNIPSWDESTGFYGPYVEGNTIYESKYNTNMYIFANRADAEAYLSGQNPKPVGGGSNSGSFNPDGFIGDPTEYNLTVNNITNDMSSCWILNKSQLNSLAEVFATGCKTLDGSDDTLGVILESSIRGLMAHGEPIDMVCDLFWLPINPDEFANISNSHIEIARDEYGVLSKVTEVVSSAGERYNAIDNLNWTLYGGAVGQAAYNLSRFSENMANAVDTAGNYLNVGLSTPPTSTQ